MIAMTCDLVLLIEINIIFENDSAVGHPSLSQGNPLKRLSVLSLGRNKNQFLKPSMDSMQLREISSSVSTIRMSFKEDKGASIVEFRSVILIWLVSETGVNSCRHRMTSPLLLR